MNIKQAKEHLKLTVQAYLAKDTYGNPEIPIVAQRPILLMGPRHRKNRHRPPDSPGVRYRHCGLHHDPPHPSERHRPASIQTSTFAGKEFRVTEYTMSEIVASIYQCIERTGLRSGILFLDEINCVSKPWPRYAPVPSVQNLWQPSDPRGLDHCRCRQPAGVQPFRPRLRYCNAGPGSPD